MRAKHLAQKNKMTKGMNAATSWVPSVFTQKDLNKARVDGLVSDEDQVIFLSTERIPKPRDGFWVMFFAFLLHGLCLPAHEFLRGLLFVYGVQLHQLTPNSILHIACFITMCELFLGIDPHFLLWRSLFRLRPSVSLSKKPELGGACISVRAESQYLEFFMAASVQGWRTKWFYIKDRKILSWEFRDSSHGVAYRGGSTVVTMGLARDCANGDTSVYPGSGPSRVEVKPLLPACFILIGQ
jgi:hypothetical protein